MVNGVLPYQEIEGLISSNKIILEKGGPLFEEKGEESPIGLASFEPSLGGKVYAMSTSILPCKNKSLSERLENERLYEFSLKNNETRFLEKGHVFVVPLNERLNLPKGYMGESTGRSSVGRTDTVLSLLTDNHQRYNFIPSGYEGKLFLEIFTESFPVEIKKGLRLNQIKFAYGGFEDLDESELKLLHNQSPLLYNEKGDSLDLDKRIEKNSLIMSLRLKGKFPVVLRAKKNVPEAIDFSRDFKNPENKYNEDYFWEKVRVKNGKIKMNPGEFYIMITKERISVPPNYVTKMIPYDINFAELKTQEADLFNPGHGYLTRGFCPVLEVSPLRKPIELRDGDPICRIKYQRLRAIPTCKLYDEREESYIKQVSVNAGKMFFRK